jgi:thymidylate kinase
MIKQVIFDGVDRSGKDTLCREFAKATNYKYVCYSRGPMSNMAYDKLFDRGYGDTELIKLAKDMGEYTLFVWVVANRDVIEKRCAETLEPKYDITEHQHAFKEAYKQLIVNDVKHCLCVSNNTTIEEALHQLKEYM